MPSSIWVDVTVLAYSGVSTVSPIDIARGSDAGTTQTPTTDSVTTSGANALVVALFINDNVGSWTAGSGMTERVDFDGMLAQDVLQSTAGATGVKTATNSVSGPNAAQIVVLRAGSSDTLAPTVTITAPTSGASVVGAAVPVSADAADNVAVTAVQFLLDGAPLGAPITTPPYTRSWDTTALANGPHTLGAQAYDAAGNVGTAAAVAVTVANPVTPPVISAVSSSAVSSSGATITWTTDKAADGLVEYGTTTAYGLATPLNPSLVTAHTAALGSLSPSTLYHFRVKSKDASGTPATSNDFTFTTASASYVRTFNGGTDEIRLSLGRINVSPTAFSNLVIARTGDNTRDKATFALIDRSGTNQYDLQLGEGQHGSVGNDVIVSTGFNASWSGFSLNITDYYFVLVTKARGFMFPRFHIYNFTTRVWYHANGNFAQDDQPGAVVGGHVNLGNYDSVPTVPWSGDMVAAGWWDRDLMAELGDSGIEAMAQSIQACLSTSPAAFWRLDQSDVAQPVIDQTGGGADQVARTGTAVRALGSAVLP
ncbi:MAG TPA: Ig-like domain-containing protein [Candidatus Limnocylindria bacterium]